MCADFALLESPKLISRKIWITKSTNIQIVSLQYFWKVQFGHNFATSNSQIVSTENSILMDTPNPQKFTQLSKVYILCTSSQFPLLPPVSSSTYSFSRVLVARARASFNFIVKYDNSSWIQSFFFFFWKWDFKKVFIALKRSL